ncbi:Spore coat polysaccharide biosynthesis protein SpsG, predicted glycosyltransferase [Pseudobutyrivibrio sp. YE44]|uniref:PseG/SpsG family protein n=1 Tax=Pseudobutyrivibrio sp. YE44 TaxID=1520802 RepID=UPI0008837686|nr:glycosyltransferase [Pseudobutyrivibrio sp. YE44]SDB54375.1 Spore coat polysaccharide biosynthesis protein SpsG, predicted glycosyltransferase [Pseudobutyrivibrio sp. YE44]
MIFFRADGNSQVGAGHVMRCLSIADAFVHAGEDVIFYTAGNELSSLIESRGIKNIVINSDFMKMESELVFLKGEIEEEKPDAIFVDSYFVTSQYLKSLQSYCHSVGGKLVYMDDVLKFAYPCDYLINYNVYAPDCREKYLKLYYGEGGIASTGVANLDLEEPGNLDLRGATTGDVAKPELLLGPEYLPIRKEFRGLPNRVMNESVSDILISTGGADFEHLALGIVKSLVDGVVIVPDGVRVHLLVGAMNTDKDEIERLASSNDVLQIEYNVKDMVALMQNCDIAVSAAGSTLYELIATQTPTITYVLADNQILGAEAFSTRDLMDYVGDIRALGEAGLISEIFERVNQYIADASLRADKIASMGEFPTDGAERIVKEILGWH